MVPKQEACRTVYWGLGLGSTRTKSVDKKFSLREAWILICEQLKYRVYRFSPILIKSAWELIYIIFCNYQKHETIIIKTKTQDRAFVFAAKFLVFEYITIPPLTSSLPRKEYEERAK